MSISTLRLSHVSDELEYLNGILRGGSQALVGLDAWGYRRVLMYDAKSGDVEVEADCLPVDSILVPGYRALEGVMLGGRYWEGSQGAIPRSGLPRWTVTAREHPVQLPSPASLAYVEESLGGDSKVVLTDSGGARTRS